MQGTIKTSKGNEQIMVGLKCNPDQCPRCGTGLFTETIDVNLTESRCVLATCTYSVRDRVGSLRSAEELLDAQPTLNIYRYGREGSGRSYSA